MLRFFRAEELFMYGHDQDLASWIIMDVLNNKHIRLIGQETSVQGIFIGPLFYYLLIPFYIIFGMDPFGGVFLVSFLSFLGILSIYYVFSRIAGRGSGILGALIYAFSNYIILADREVVPTMPVFLWSSWYLYSLWLLYKSNYKLGLLLLGVLIGLVWHINLGLFVLLPLPIFSYFFSPRRKRINIIDLVGFFSGFAVLMSPYFVFEIRHGFIQTKVLIASLISKNSSNFIAKLDRVLLLVYTNASRLISGDLNFIHPRYYFFAICLILVYLFVKKVFSRRFLSIIIMWQVLYIAFFSLNSIIVSEYYLNGMIVPWIFILSVFVSYLVEKRGLVALFVYLAVLLFITINFYKFFSIDLNRSGYLYKKALVSFIRKDSKSHSYPCISVSYITKPGYELGYRYLFVLENMHVNRPESGAPVYTIVFPHNMVSRIDMSFGALGLVLPDYDKYKKSDVLKSCSGANSNLTDPMFGFTN